MKYDNVIQMKWTCRNFKFELSNRPLIMGIVNVTPDSFSDGGRFVDAKHAVDHALQLVADGADILDIGGESTRPGATPVEEADELRRVMPVLELFGIQSKTPISIDTMKPAVAKAAVAAGAFIINDVSGFRDPAMIAVAAETGAGVIVNHMSGLPPTMQVNPHYDDVVREVNDAFNTAINDLVSTGVRRASICLDPGIGFGKTFEHTMTQLRRLPELQAFALPVCLGVSRKGFLGQITGRDRLRRDVASVAVALHAMAMNAVQIVRVHDVAAHKDAIAVFTAIRQNKQ
jgi:dihydropteroate synthase